MESKHLIFLTAFIILVPTGIAVSLFSQKARDAVFFLLVFGTTLTNRLDINFISREWYRGTTRGIEVSFVDMLAIILFVSALMVPGKGDHPRWFWPASLGGMLIYTLYCCFSVAISDPKLFGLFELSKIFRGIIFFMAVAMFVRGEREVKIFLLGLCAAIGYVGGYALVQRYMWGMHRVYGSLDHPNSLSMYCCIAAPVLTAAAMSNLSKLMRALCLLCTGLAVIGVVLSISRTGVAVIGIVTAGAAVSCTSIRVTPKKVATVFLVLLATIGVAAKSWDSVMDRFDRGSLAEEYMGEYSMQAGGGRGVYLRYAEMLLLDYPLGCGLNNWSYVVSAFYGDVLNIAYMTYRGTDLPPEKVRGGTEPEAPAHSLAALTVGELGVPGLIIFMALWGRWFQIGTRFLHRRSPEILSRFGVGSLFAISACFLQSITEWEFRQTQLFLLMHIVLGTLAAVYAIRRHEERRRR